MTQEITMADFIQANKLKMTSEKAKDNPHMNALDMDHWKCKITQGKHSMTLYFSKGYGHNGKEPQLDEVLDCLASDASSVINSDFEEWARDMGFDEDSRKAEKTYKTIERQSDKLQRLLGGDAYQTLLYSVERL